VITPATPIRRRLDESHEPASALEQGENAAVWGGTTEDERRNIRLLRHAV
jgi:hypothetical protein